MCSNSHRRCPTQHVFACPLQGEKRIVLQLNGKVSALLCSKISSRRCVVATATAAAIVAPHVSIMDPNAPGVHVIDRRHSCLQCSFCRTSSRRWQTTLHRNDGIKHQRIDCTTIVLAAERSCCSCFYTNWYCIVMTLVVSFHQPASDNHGR